MYLDGSALCRFLPGVRFYEDFTAWAIPNLDKLATSQLGLTELRQAAALYPREERDNAFVVIEEVRSRIPVVRFSDDNVQVSTHAASVLRPFAALHLGAAVAHPSIDTIVTYDPELARAAELYSLQVLSPGLPAGWHNGPVG
jgi:predicted nucleic acid-binding protein